MSSSTRPDYSKPALPYSYIMNGYGVATKREESTKRDAKQMSGNIPQEQQQVRINPQEQDFTRFPSTSGAQKHILPTAQSVFQPHSLHRGFPLPKKNRFPPRHYQNQCNLLTSGMDVVEYQSDYRIYLDMPSFKRESIRILVQKGGLRIEGNRQLFYEGCEKILSQHRFTGHYSIFIPFDSNLVSTKNATATFVNGELCIILKKRSAESLPVQLVSQSGGAKESVRIQELHADKRISVQNQMSS